MIQIKNFSLKFPSKTLFTDLTIEFENSLIYGVFGLNSVGKTSLFKAIYGMHKYEGSIDYNSKKIKKDNISFLETECYFYDGLTGKQYLEIFSSQSTPIFDVFSLAELLALPLDELIDNYSTGMKKKISFLGVLKTNREIFLLDEPFNGVDIESIEIMKSIIKQLKKKSKTIFITSHIIEHLKDLSDFFFIIDNPTNLKLWNVNEFSSYLNNLTDVIDEKVEKSILKPYNI
jgi:ABC-2 type transport system ATP-binding protein